MELRVRFQQLFTAVWNWLVALLQARKEIERNLLGMDWSLQWQHTGPAAAAVSWGSCGAGGQVPTAAHSCLELASCIVTKLDKDRGAG